MIKKASYLLILLKRIGWLLLIYFFLRLLFFWINYEFFNDISFAELLTIFLAGLRFDIAAILFLNSPYILLYLLPGNFKEHAGYRKALKAIFIITNSVGIFFSCIDLFYFKFILKRSTSDVFQMITLTNNKLDILPRFIADFWPSVLSFVLFLFVIIYLYGRTKENIQSNINNKKEWFFQLGIFMISMGLVLFGFRGGLQFKPIGIITAGKYTTPKNYALVLNTPFTIIKTAQKTPLSNPEWFTEDKLKTIYNPIHHFKKSTAFKRKNVVLIILESFSTEYIGSYSGLQTYTPFLDSLSKVSFNFKNAYANGKKSIEGVPAIMAGIPALMENPFISSAYSANQITTIANVLKKEGYKTSFFHGGTNGTMGLDAFCRMAGIEEYYGRTEYNNEKDYDGFWGIPDHLFFQYFASKLSSFQQPFHSTIFTLSSHHPFKVPKQYDYLEKGELEIHKSIRYADISLKLFFEKVKNEKWYKNTVFIITADHPGTTSKPFYQSRVGTYAIPIMIFDPSDNIAGSYKGVVQQLDILPGVLDYLNYSKPFFSFGKSLFDTSTGNYSFNYLGGTYQIMDESHYLEFDGEKPLSLYNYVEDSTLSKRNLLMKQPEIKSNLEKKLKARIQTFNQSLIKNKISVETYE